MTWEMGDGSYENVQVYDERVTVGSLLWDPKGGEGHVIVGSASCGEQQLVGSHPERTADCGCGGWGDKPCPSSTLVCECGEDDGWRDHHYGVLALSAASGGTEGVL